MNECTYLERRSIFGLLLVDDAEPEVYLICLLKVGLHLHDLREGLFRVVKGAVTIV